MALVINCPECGKPVINNGQDCPFCSYSFKEGKTRAQMEQELLEAEEALRAEEAAKAAEQARIAQEQARAAEQAKAVEQARIAREQAMAAAVQQAAKGSNIFAKFQQKTIQRTPQVDISEKVNDIDNLPEIPENSDKSSLPPMQLDAPVPLAKIASTPAVPLTPIEKQKESSVLPPMQPEREVTIEEIQNTPAVQLTPIQGENITDALPDISSPEAAPPKSAQTQIEVEIPQSTNNVIRNKQQVGQWSPSLDQQRATQTRPQQPVAPVQPQVSQQPVAPVQPQRPQPTVAVNTQQPAPQRTQPPKRQWSSNPNEFKTQQPVQSQQPPVQPQRPQPTVAVHNQLPVPQRTQTPKRQWSSNPNDFKTQHPVQPQQPPVQPQRPQPTVAVHNQQPVPQRTQPPKRQWSSNPNDFNSQPTQSRPQNTQGRPQPLQNRSQNTQGRPQAPQNRPQNQGRPQQRRPQHGGKIELQPIEQEQTEYTATGERLENLPPQQTPTNPNFDTESYVHNLKRQIREDQSLSQQNRQHDDVIKNAEQVEVKPMKFDGKPIKGATVNVVKAPSGSHKALAPIIIVVILVLALLGIVFYIFSSGILNPKTANISFTKPDSWDDEVYVYVFDGNNKNAERPGQKMTKGDGKTYTYVVDENLTNGKLIFSDGNKPNSNRYPLTDDEALTVEKDKTYTTSSKNATNTASSKSSASSSSQASK